MPSRRASFPSLDGTIGLPLYSYLLHISRKVGYAQAWMFFRWPPVCHSSTDGALRVSQVPGKSPPYLCPAHKTPAAPATPLPSKLTGVAPAAMNTKAATTYSISRLIHTASAHSVYASSFGFPYTGKTRFRRVAALTGWDLNPLDFDS